MSMRNSFAWLLAIVATGLWAQAPGGSRVSGRIQLPPDSPVTLVSADWSESRSTERGGAALIDLHTDLLLRNTTQRKIRGLMLSVISQQVGAGGRASVTKASLDVGPGDNFPVKIDLRLLRPIVGLNAGGNSTDGPSVEVTLDGILFEDLSFYGPNRMDSRRVLTAWEMEAQRDRRYFAQVLASQGTEGLKREALSSLDRQAEMPRLDVHYARAERTTAGGASRTAKLALLNFPDSPVEAVDGTARVVSDVSMMPRLDVVNRSKRPVRSMEVGWLVRDAAGKEFLGGSVPAAKNLTPGARGSIGEEASLQFSGADGAKLNIGSVEAFVSQVEFADGSVWIPSRAALSDAQYRRMLTPSAEEQRLTTIYRKRGLGALVLELKKFE
jgi:hypothetical protein